MFLGLQWCRWQLERSAEACDESHWQVRCLLLDWHTAGLLLRYSGTLALGIVGVFTCFAEGESEVRSVELSWPRIGATGMDQSQWSLPFGGIADLIHELTKPLLAFRGSYRTVVVVGKLRGASVTSPSS